MVPRDQIISVADLSTRLASLEGRHGGTTGISKSMQPGKFRMRPGWPCTSPAVLPHVDGQVADYGELAPVRPGPVLVAISGRAGYLDH